MGEDSTDSPIFAQHTLYSMHTAVANKSPDLQRETCGVGDVAHQGNSSGNVGQVVTIQGKSRGVATSGAGCQVGFSDGAW